VINIMGLYACEQGSACTRFFAHFTHNFLLPFSLGPWLASSLPPPQIATHHFAHGCFLPEAGAVPELQAAADAGRLNYVPCAIVHGRHDVVCPLAAATTLHGVWPGSTLRIVESGAHALFERPMRTAVQAVLAQLVGDLVTGRNSRKEAGAEGDAVVAVKRPRTKDSR
jgi:pimeloyl-ACP methyl ester carboxylesterase